MDEDLMSPKQQTLLCAVVDAINAGADFHAAARERVSPTPARDEIWEILRILRLPVVGFLHGEPSSMVLRRILGLLRARVVDSL